MNKRVWILITCIVLLLPLTFAAERHNYVFNETLTPIFTIIQPRDIIVFEYPVRVYKEPQLIDGKEHIEFEVIQQEEAIMLREIRTTKEGLHVADLTIFIEGAPTPHYLTLAANDSTRLDFEFDELKDIEIQILAVDPEQGLTINMKPYDTSQQAGNPHIFLGGTPNPVVSRGGEESLTFMDKLKLRINSMRERITGSAVASPVRYAKQHWIVTSIIVLVLLVLIYNHRKLRAHLRNI